MILLVRHKTTNKIALSLNLPLRLAKLQTLAKLGYGEDYVLEASSTIPRLQEAAAQFVGVSTPVAAPEPKTCVRRTALGDLLMLFLALEEYTRQTGEKIVLACSKPFIELCHRQKFIDEVCDFADLGERRFTKIFDLEGAVDFAPPAQQRARQVMFAAALGVTLSVKKSPNYIHLLARERRWAQTICAKLPRPIIGMMPVSKSYLRDWGREAELVAQCPQYTFLVFHHQPLPEFDGIQNVVNFAGQTTVLEMCALAEQTDGGGFTDTGLMHVYGNLGKPYVLVAGGVMPPKLRIAYYDSVYPLISDARCGCPQLPCFDGIVYNCRGQKHFKACMSEKVLPLAGVIERLRSLMERENEQAQNG